MTETDISYTYCVFQRSVLTTPFERNREKRERKGGRKRTSKVTSRHGQKGKQGALQASSSAHQQRSANPVEASRARSKACDNYACINGEVQPDSRLLDALPW